MVEITAIDALTTSPHAEVFDEQQPRTVQLTLDAGEGVPAHTHPGTNIVLHLLSGRLELSLDDECYELSSGEIARFSGEREVAPHAIDESTAILVLAPVEDE